MRSSGETEAGGVPPEDAELRGGTEISGSSASLPATLPSCLPPVCVALSKRIKQRRDLHWSPESLAWSVKAVPRGICLWAEGVARGEGAGRRDQSGSVISSRVSKPHKQGWELERWRATEARGR